MFITALFMIVKNWKWPIYLIKKSFQGGELDKV